MNTRIHQSMIKNKMPDRIWQEATLEKERYRMNVVLEHLKDWFPNLPDITHILFVVPHSSAVEERVLSLIKKTKIEVWSKTEFWSNLQLGGSLNAIMIVKMYFLSHCRHVRSENHLINSWSYAIQSPWNVIKNTVVQINNNSNVTRLGKLTLYIKFKL